MKSIFMLLQVITLSLALGNFASAGQRAEKPIYLRYEQRLIFSYFLAGVGETPEKQVQLAERLTNTLSRIAKTPQQTVQVQNFSDFLKAYQEPWPQSYSLDSDLALIEKSEPHPITFIQGATPALQAQIQGFMIQQQSLMIKKYKASNLGKFSAPADIEMPNQATLADEAELKKWIFKGFGQASQMLKDNMTVIQHLGTDMFSDIQQTGSAMAQSGKLSSMDEASSLFMTTVIQEYFGRLSLQSKKQIISQIVGRDMNMSLQQRFELMVLSSGPQFQKLLQVIARESGISEDLLKIFKQLESKAPAVPAPIVQELFESERSRYNWISYDLKPLGTGTMAQVHRGKIEINGHEQDVVIRFLKPEIEKRVQEDFRILSELAPVMDNDPRFAKAGFPKLLPVVTDLNRTVMDELDLQATIQRQKLAKKIYPRDLDVRTKDYSNVLEIHVPDVYASDADSKLHVQELVAGEKLDQVAGEYQDSIPDLKKAIAEQIARTWSEEVFFGSGFFHSDLHQGNFLVDFTDPKITVNILDFGMGGVISSDTQMRLMEVGAGIDLDRADLITDAFWNLSQKENNGISLDQFKAKVQARIDAIKAGKLAWESFNQWTTWAMNEGIRFPYEFVSLNRGAVILDKLLKDSGSPMTLATLTRKLGMSHMAKTISNLRATKLVSWADFIKMGLVSRAAQSQPVKAAAVTRSSLECRRIFLQDRSSSLGSFMEGLQTWTDEAF